MRPAKRRAFVAPRFLGAAMDVSQPDAQAQAPSVAEPAVPQKTVLKPIQAFKAPQAQQPALAKVPQARKPADNEQQPEAEYKSVLYIKKDLFLKKKVAKMYMDGLLSLAAGGASILHSLDTGKVITTGKAKRATAKDLQPPGGAGGARGGKGRGKKDEEEEVEEDDDLVRYILGTFVIEIQGDVPSESYRSGACFTRGATVYGSAAAASQPSVGATFKTAFRPVAKGSAAPASGGGAKARVLPKGLYDPNPGALVLNRDEWEAGNCGTAPPVAPVVVDPYLGRHLRPHQEEGVRFMYDCVTGKRAPGFTGCVLADEMGLGKTLQVLTLVWTLLRQGANGKPLARKVLVVTPATLCGNWEKEVKQWLGSERLQVFMLGAQQDAAERVQQFKHGAVVRLCITSYETLRKHSAALAGAIDLVVCDEGHRLKAVGGSKTTEALLQLGCPRRVLLTGTPIQNNLEEFYALISFVAPDLLGAPSAFRRVYADPISRATERDASPEVKELGSSRASELTRKAAAILLRRTQAILTKHLPPLTNYCLFCKPTSTQVGVYQAILKQVLAGLTQGGSDVTLGAITALSKVCNHPGLLAAPDAEEEGDEPAAKRPKGTAAAATAAAAAQTKQAGEGVAWGWVPPLMSLEADNPAASGKMAVLRTLMEHIVAGGERVVVVSTSTVALDAVNRMVAAPMGLHTVRIDGSTSVDERQCIVDAFNTRGVGQVFLLSTRAGGAGLNLIGASHLVLYSSDWNPAADQQAMARIWRDGQQRPCHVWRLLTTGTIEEKVYQRQIMKGNLALATLSVGESGGGTSKGARQFTREELRALFVLTTGTACETRDLLTAGAAGVAAQAQAHVRWLVENAPRAAKTGAAGVGKTGLSGWSGSALPPGASAALQAVMDSGCLSAASVALKSEEGTGTALGEDGSAMGGEPAAVVQPQQQQMVATQWGQTRPSGQSRQHGERQAKAPSNVDDLMTLADEADCGGTAGGAYASLEDDPAVVQAPPSKRPRAPLGLVDSSDDDVDLPDDEE